MKYVFRNARNFNFKLALDVAWKAKNTIYPGLNMYDGTCSLNTDCGICKSKNSNGDAVTCATSVLPSKSLNGICSTCMNDGNECCTTPTCGNTDGSGSAFSQTLCTSKSKLIKSDLSTISCSTAPCTDDDCCYLPAFVEKTSGKCTDLENGWMIKNKNDCVKANLEMGDREITVKEITKATQTPGCLPPVLPISGDRLVFNKNFDSASTCDTSRQLYAGTVLNIFDSLDKSMVVDWATDKFTLFDESLTSQEFSFYKYIPTDGKSVGAPISSWATDGTNAILSGDTVALYHPSTNQIYDCAHGVARLIFSNQECLSPGGEKKLAISDATVTIESCAALCRAESGCQTFIVIVGRNCIQEIGVMGAADCNPYAHALYSVYTFEHVGACKKKTWNGLPKGQWGSPYRIYKIGGNVGDAVYLGDAIYFDR